MRAQTHTLKQKHRALFDWHYVPDESRRAYRLACILFWSILMYFAFQRYVVELGIIEERSMLPTLQENSFFLVNKYIYHIARPQRGDIVVLRPGQLETDQYVKRVIAISGDLLAMRSGRVYLNGRLIDEPYAQGGTFPDFGPYWIMPDHFFVLGDNRKVSLDSRDFGAVALSNIEGKISPGELFALR